MYINNEAFLITQKYAKVWINTSALTELFVYFGGPPQHHASDEEVDMTEDDERRRGSRSTVVLLN